MGAVSMGCGGIASGNNFCMVAGGLFEGISREERRARRQADLAERRFRASKGYCKESIWQRVCRRLHVV
ncbi:MAG: hypothetical protein RRY65_06825 [Pseudoflavonifractor sp.]